jgi:hypothetical protein
VREERVAAACDEHAERRLDRIVAQCRRQHVAQQVVDRRQRQPARGRQALRRRQAHEQCADQARSVRDRHAIDCVQAGAGLLERVLDHCVHQLQVAARRDLGHHAAVLGVKETLRCDHVRQDVPVGRHDRGTGVVAARFDSENHVAGTADSAPAVRHMIRASSLLSW